MGAWDRHDLSCGIAVGSLLGITLAAEDILANIAGGLVILSSRPFTIGDYIEVSGVSGTVEEISLNHTKLTTPDGLLVMLPNKTLADSQMTNYTALGQRRITQVVSASYQDAADTVKAACQSAIGKTPEYCRTQLPLSMSPSMGRAPSNTRFIAGPPPQIIGREIFSFRKSPPCF